jgi:hypothetical protein
MSTRLIWFMIGPSRGAVLNSVMKLQIPLKTGNFLIIKTTICLSRGNLLQAIGYIEPGIFLYVLATCLMRSVES